jgi:Tfp pilus assembly protein PilO
MAMKTGLEGRLWYFGLAVGLLVLGVLGYLGSTLQIQAMQETRERQVRDIEKLQGEIARAEAAQARLPQFRREVALLEVELQKLLVILPPRRDVPTLLRRFRTLAEQGDFALNTFAPSSEVEKDFYNEWPISVELQGTYHNLAEFFDRVSRFSRIFNVDSLRIRQRPQAQHSITANFVAKTFVYKELVEAEAEGDDR